MANANHNFNLSDKNVNYNKATNLIHNNNNNNNNNNNDNNNNNFIMITNIERNIDEVVVKICEQVKEHAQSMKDRMHNCLEKDQNKPTLGYNFDYKKPDLQKINWSSLVGDLDIKEKNVLIEQKPTLKDNPASKSYQIISGIENDKNCKISFYVGDITNMNSDYCLVFIGEHLRNNVISKSIITKAGKDFLDKKFINGYNNQNGLLFISNSGKMNFKNLFYIDLKRMGESQLVAYLTKEIIALFNYLIKNKMNITSLSVSIDYQELVENKPANFGKILWKLFVNDILDSNIFGIEVNLFSQSADAFQILAPLSQKLTNFPNSHLDKGFTFQSGTTLELYRGSLLDLKVDAILFIVDWNFNLTNTFLGKEILNKIGPEFQTEIDTRKNKLKSNNNNIIVTKGYNLNCDFILCCRTIYSINNSDKRNSIQICLKETANIMKDRDLKSLAMPLLGTGKYGVNINDSMHILLDHFIHSDFRRTFVAIPPGSEHLFEIFENYVQNVPPNYKKKKSIWFEQTIQSDPMDRSKQSMEEKMMDTSEASSVRENMAGTKSGNNESEYLISFADDSNEEIKINGNIPNLKETNKEKNETFFDDKNYNNNGNNIINNKNDNKNIEVQKKTFEIGQLNLKVDDINIKNRENESKLVNNDDNKPKKYQWYYVEKGKKFKYPPKINKMLEKNFNIKAESRWSEMGKIFVVNYAKMTEVMQRNEDDDDDDSLRNKDIEECLEVKRLTDDEDE